ncbi:MAG: thioredoxin family protein, partial [Myxococcota bacterium]|nr:thioredoxin family protein [Myxococcota bacterium]
SSGKSKLLAWLAALAIIGVGIHYLNFETRKAGSETLASERIEWRAFEGEQSLELADQGHTLLLDFTADWCPTCKANEAVAIETDAVGELIRELGVIPLKADMTADNPVASQWVEHYGRVAIPLVVVIPAGRRADAIVLPEVITESMMLDALRQAGPSTAP